MQELLKTIFEGATAVGTLIAAGSLFFLKRALEEQRKALEQQHDALVMEYNWRKTTAAIDLMRDWNEKVSSLRDIAVDLGKKIYGQPEGTLFIKPIDGAEAAKLWGASQFSIDQTEMDRSKLNSCLISLLNYFEYLSSAYLNGSVEQQVIKPSFKDPMSRWHKSLRGYIEWVDDKTGRTDKNPVTWKPFCDLMDQWEKDGRQIPAPAFRPHRDGL